MATVPTPWRMGANGIIPSTSFNAGVYDVLTFLMNPPMCEIQQNTVQSVPNGGAALNFDIEVIDTDNMHSTVTNTSRITANTLGRYLIWGASSWAANATGTRGGWIMLNGIAINGTEFIVQAGATGGTTVPMRVKLVYMNPGDYIEMLGWHSSGGALNTLPGSQSAPTLGARWIGSS